MLCSVWQKKRIAFKFMIMIFLILFTFLIIIVTIIISIGKTWIPVFTVLNFNGLNFDPLCRKGFANFCEAGRTSLIDQVWFYKNLCCVFPGEFI